MKKGDIVEFKCIRPRDTCTGFVLEANEDGHSMLVHVPESNDNENILVLSKDVVSVNGNVILKLGDDVEFKYGDMANEGKQIGHGILVQTDHDDEYFKCTVDSRNYSSNDLKVTYIAENQIIKVNGIEVPDKINIKKS